VLLVLSCCAIAPAADDPAPKEGGAKKAAIVAEVASSLASDSDRIRQLALDGDAATFFASGENPTAEDHFTLTLDEPVQLRSIEVQTGRPDGSDLLESGVLEVSADGKSFSYLARFSEGTARHTAEKRLVRAVRVRSDKAQEHPMVIREIVVDSDPAVATFQYPVEITVHVDDAPDMRAWLEKTARICERAYPMINRELASEGFTPPRTIAMTLKSDYRGVAATGGNRIVGSVDYFRRHQDDVGAMVHETTHVVQHYRGRRNPGWLVEGVADYVRFFKFEPGKIGRINAQRARYNGSYRVSAAFLAYLNEKYEQQLVRKLNEAMRKGRYDEQLFKQLTGKPLAELGEEWQATLRQ